MLTWGWGQAGSLGHGGRELEPVPREVRALQGLRVCQVAAGWAHTVFVTEAGTLYACGDGAFGQLGLGTWESCVVPQRVDALASHRVQRAACGMRHTLVATVAPAGELQQLFGFGSNRRGQAGMPLELQESTQPPCASAGASGHSLPWKVAVPERLGAFDGVGIRALACGGDHSAAVTATGGLFVWGRGFGCTTSGPDPQAVGDGSLRFHQVALGWNHGLALTEEGEIWSWGSNRYGQLGVNPSSEPSYSPALPPSNPGGLNGGPGATFGVWNLHKVVCGGVEKRASAIAAGAEQRIALCRLSPWP